MNQSPKQRKSGLSKRGTRTGESQTGGKVHGELNTWKKGTWGKKGEGGGEAEFNK